MLSQGLRSGGVSLPIGQPTDVPVTRCESAAGVTWGSGCVLCPPSGGTPRIPTLFVQQLLAWSVYMRFAYPG